MARIGRRARTGTPHRCVDRLRLGTGPPRSLLLVVKGWRWRRLLLPLEEAQAEGIAAAAVAHCRGYPQRAAPRASAPVPARAPPPSVLLLSCPAHPAKHRLLATHHCVMTVPRALPRTWKFFFLFSGVESWNRRGTNKKKPAPISIRSNRKPAICIAVEAPSLGSSRSNGEPVVSKGHLPYSWHKFPAVHQDRARADGCACCGLRGRSKQDLWHQCLRRCITHTHKPTRGCICIHTYIYPSADGQSLTVSLSPVRSLSCLCPRANVSFGVQSTTPTEFTHLVCSPPLTPASRPWGVSSGVGRE